MSIILNGTTGITTPGINNTGAFTFGGAIDLPGGTVGAPSLTTTGDLDTGIYFPAANQIAISTAGTQRVFVSASGDVGIGTGSPGVRLHVTGSNGDIFRVAGANENFYVNCDTQGSYIGNGAAAAGEFIYFNAVSDYMSFWTGTVERARIDSSGNLGVGTTSPSSSSGFTAITINSNSTGGGQLRLTNSGDLGLSLAQDSGNVYFEAGGTRPIRIFTNGSERVRITSAGNVGIGTTTANGKLQFASDTNARKIVLYEGANNDFQNYGFGVLSATLLYSTYSVGDDHVFAVGTSSTTRKELMRINSTYNAVQIPGQPGFKQAWASRVSTGSSRILGTNQGDSLVTGRDEFNQGSHFSTATGKFTCPVAGMYVFGISLMRFASSGSVIDVRIYKNGGVNSMWARTYASAYTSDYQQSMLVTITDAAANDYFEFFIGPNTSMYDDDTYCFGYLIG